ncbi:MAG: hypothetical protein U5O39_14670 [Gammaproteobacteria bacterium]|nr:hypothetical protein [Gammaproteobacteria bacterium]
MSEIILLLLGLTGGGNEAPDKGPQQVTTPPSREAQAPAGPTRASDQAKTSSAKEQLKEAIEQATGGYQDGKRERAVARHHR